MSTWEGDGAQSLVLSRPFSPATGEGQICVCVACGERQQAFYKISRYPFRWTPNRRWSVEGRTQALRCAQCTAREVNTLEFYETHDVWVYANSHAGPPCVKVFPRRRKPPQNQLPAWLETLIRIYTGGDQ